MNYTEELKNLLRPLGIYDVDRGVGAAELNAIGSELTGIWSALETAEREAIPVTAEDAGLSAWEVILPFLPRALTTENRRAAIAALLQIDGMGFTAAALNAAIAGCGIPALVEETAETMTVQVSFPGLRGEPEGLSGLRRRIEQILPCHLSIEYVFVYATWAEMEAMFSTWAAAENAEESWRELEQTGGGIA